MPQDVTPMEAAPEAGVVGLLQRLRSHICCESRSDFRRVLPVYQRLLSPREDAGISVQNELLGIRAKLLACGEAADVVDVVGRMDRVVERCMGIEEQQKQSAEAAVPMEEVMQLLVALAGGQDGETFVLEDPMQTTNEKSSLVFFYDGTQVVHYGEQMQPADWGEASSITENSSWGSECSLDITEPWIARTYAWEDLGDRMGLPESYAKPPVREEKRSLRDLVIPNALACNGDTALEIYEEDLIEDSLRALSGIESTLFRRDFQSATFELPGMRKLKLPNTTVSATKSVLEVFRKAGTMVMRLELLAIYYSQDAARGGKTLQAMGDALQLYLSTHRTLVETIMQQCLESSSSEEDHEDGIFSVTKLLCKTRKMCRVLEVIGDIFHCDDSAFWPLLQHGKFPRGVALLDHLHRHASSLRVDDSSGRIQDLIIWFLVKSCSPLLAVLSDLISLGRVDESTDPFDEFEATTWSRNLLEKAATGAGDGLFNEELLTEATEMLPKFLEEIAPLIAHLSQVQALLRSVDAIASTHPLVNMQPLTLLTRGDEATEHANEWMSTIVGALAYTVVDTHRSEDTETYKSGLGEISPAAEEEEEPIRDFMREDAEAKRSSQLQQRDMLDQQVLEKKQYQLHSAQEEEVDNAKRLKEAVEALADQKAYGREVLLNKYSILLNGAEERHDYMKWRRDRAVRLSTAKEQLQHLRADDTTQWTADKDKRRNESAARAGEGEAVNSVTEENDDNAPKSAGIMAAGVPSTPVSTSEWRASVKVNREAGSRTSVTMDDGAWRTSVKVNKEAGNRSSGVLSDPASTEAVPHKTGIRILNEPGGSGADMYETLYGGSNDLLEENGNVHSAAACATADVEMEDDNRAVDSSLRMDDATPGEPFPKAAGDGDVDMQDASHADEEEFTNQRSAQGDGPRSEASRMTRAAAEPAKSTRLSLPPVHPFFSVTISQEDSEVLIQAITETGLEADFTSFASIVNCCVEIPVRLVTEKLEQVAVDWFRNSLQMLDHLRWLSKLMLMSEGLCMDILARDFLLGLNPTTRVNWGLEGRLSSALTLAMIEGSVALDVVAQAFHYETTAALSQVLDSLTMTPAIASVLNDIELVYDVKWPLGFVITTESLDHYKEMHRFLLHVRLTSVEMREAWGMLRTIRRQGQLSPVHERMCGGVVHRMQAFLRAFNETFATKVLKTAWSELELALEKATKLVELRRYHEEYVSVAVRCCFLGRPTLAVRSAFLDVVSAAWSLSGFVRALKRQVTGRASEETRIRALCEAFDVELRVLVDSLQSVSRDAERNTRDFSEGLLLRLNFNQYYSTDDVPPAAAGARVPRADDVVAVEF
ncbi:hypothetical protein PHYPSEUDO_000423 [Phytophthora pseudosyringae]|uniref:Gamma tubulin complex component C-terminal domain-containing protein n=1 Tax=Phytophthora pseudosyringae TaxID=221518 RepID=A0A8T1VYE5_9STRA|nr:hypothetical protein PHYPSEUDO_000423 [Phytophthora pseudosyringae]